MGKVIKTVTVCTCDRCGKEGDTEDGCMSPHEYGGLTIKYNGHISGITWQGDAGGVVYKGEKWLCLSCTKDFLKFVGE